MSYTYKLNTLDVHFTIIYFKVTLATYNITPAHSEAFSLLAQETPQWMSKKGNNKETPEWVDRDDSSLNVVKNKFTSQEDRPQQNTPKVFIVLYLGLGLDSSFFIPFLRNSTKSKNSSARFIIIFYLSI